MGLGRLVSHPLGGEEGNIFKAEGIVRAKAGRHERALYILRKADCLSGVCVYVCVWVLAEGDDEAGEVVKTNLMSCLIYILSSK